MGFGWLLVGRSQFMHLFRRRRAQFRDDILDMPRAVPEAMKTPAFAEQERCAALAIKFFRMRRQIAKSDPRMAIRIRKRSCRAPDLQVALFAEYQQPRVMLCELVAAACVGRNLFTGEIQGSKQGDKLVSGKACGIDRVARRAVELNIGNAEREVGPSRAATIRARGFDPHLRHLSH